MGAVLLLGVATEALSADLSADEAVTLMAERLQQSQVSNGPEQGLWPDEADFMGPTTAGVACAFDWTHDVTYWTTARFAAYYLLHQADLQGNLLGDEAYAMVRMSEVRKLAESPSTADRYYGVLALFYDSLRNPAYEGSTKKYLRHFDTIEPSTNVFYFAHHVLAAYYVDNLDKEVWRDALISWLSRVDDESVFPVVALGAATWALAEIDALDDTPITSYASSPCWEGIVARDLPGLLLRHQVPEGEPYPGSFYWRFDHTAGGADGQVAGFTEDTVYGTLGLAAAASREIPVETDRIEQAIRAAQKAILEGVGADGKVYEHLSQSGEAHHVFAGEVLEALWKVKQYLDSQANVEATGQTVSPSL
jgi:hypothetical protein